MNDIIYIKSFFDFLKAQGVFYEYKVCFRNYQRLRFSEHIFKNKYFLLKDPNLFVLDAFGWTESNLQFGFNVEWGNIHSKWGTLYKKIWNKYHSNNK